MLDRGIWQWRCQVSEIVISKADNASVLPLCLAALQEKWLKKKTL